MGDKDSIILNSLLYILEKFDGRTTGKHQLFKILYFAEQKHLVKYGISITTDNYCAMDYGPVPSRAFDLIKNFLLWAPEAIVVSGQNVTGTMEPDLDWLSRSEMDCIDESFEENKNLSFGELTEKSHDLAWQEADRFMDDLQIAKAGGATEGVLKYIDSKRELENLSFG